MLAFDAEAYAAFRGVLNAGGGRGYDAGVRIVACAFCGNDDGKAWINVERGTAGCFHQSCELGAGAVGLVKWAQRAEGFRTRAQTELWLEREFPGATVPRAAPVAERPADWVRWPDGVRWFRAYGAGAGAPGRPSNGTGAGRLHDEAAAFLRRQWGLTLADAARAGWGYCTAGRFAWRIVIPVVMGGVPAQFQARSYRHAEPKYLSGTEGVDAARGTDACLYGLDALGEGGDVILVEGAADVARWHGNMGVRPERLRGARTVGGGGSEARVCGDGRMAAGYGGGVAVGLLGAQLTPAKAALLAAKRPGRVVVALDADAARASRLIAEQLRGDWGLATEAATWDGGKDAASGGRLVLLPR